MPMPLLSISPDTSQLVSMSARSQLQISDYSLWPRVVPIALAPLGRSTRDQAFDTIFLFIYLFNFFSLAPLIASSTGSGTPSSTMLFKRTWSTSFISFSVYRGYKLWYSPSDRRFVFFSRFKFY